MHIKRIHKGKRMAVCIFQKCCSSMSGLIFSSRIFFAPQGMEFISHPFEPWAGTRVCVYVCVSVCAHTCSVVSNSLRPRGLLPIRLLCPWDSPGKNTGVVSRALLQGIFPTQGLNPHLLDLWHCRWILYH